MDPWIHGSAAGAAARAAAGAAAGAAASAAAVCTLSRTSRGALDFHSKVLIPALGGGAPCGPRRGCVSLPRAPCCVRLAKKYALCWLRCALAAFFRSNLAVRPRFCSLGRPPGRPERRLSRSKWLFFRWFCAVFHSIVRSFAQSLCVFLLELARANSTLHPQRCHPTIDT